MCPHLNLNNYRRPWTKCALTPVDSTLDPKQLIAWLGGWELGFAKNRVSVFATVIFCAKHSDRCPDSSYDQYYNLKTV